MDSAPAAYERDRRSRTRLTACRSHRTGIAAHRRAAPATAVRDLMLRLTPCSAVPDALGPSLGRQPPGDDAAAG
ncbi:hypothetical protein [Streptomyces thermodiastaticus]|jgi:hypothetical protein|uniref:hypothetical protein n=1 Tax=Streptomyces thermodiastaticus TaxID=44061 RepID=UPI0016753F79|nr:hypothetical protein [Streptomyces thermodiastaticus]MCE7553330.1 hypothetical protein [Streptomyces thermodiastaticus]